MDYACGGLWRSIDLQPFPFRPTDSYPFSPLLTPPHLPGCAGSTAAERQETYLNQTYGPSTMNCGLVVIGMGWLLSTLYLHRHLGLHPYSHLDLSISHARLSSLPSPLPNSLSKISLDPHPPTDVYTLNEAWGDPTQKMMIQGTEWT